MIGEIGTDICYETKMVDMNNNIQPAQVPRGYGGVAILWKKQIDHLVKPLSDGGERIQCVEFIDNYTRLLLIVSVYLPTKGCHDIDEYKDSIDQLYEICIKYKTTHAILIGGDLNENLNKENGEKRSIYIKQFINDCNLNICYAGSTYINPQGQDCSEIDYFLFSKDTSRTFSEKCILSDMTTKSIRPLSSNNNV